MPKKTGTNTTAHTTPPQMPDGARDAAPPLALEAARMALARKLARLVSDWRQCPQRACRRHRRCETQAAICLSPRRSSVARSEAEDKALRAALKRALDAAAAREGAT